MAQCSQPEAAARVAAVQGTGFFLAGFFLVVIGWTVPGGACGRRLLGD